MTLQHSYGTDGLSKAFAFSFPIDQEADIQVLIDNVEQTSGYTVHGAASPGGGVVVFLSALTAGKTVLIRHRGRSAVSSADASSGYLSDKLVAGAGISLTPQEIGDGRQVLVVANTDESSDLYLKKDATEAEIAAFLVEYGVATDTLDNVDPDTGRAHLLAAKIGDSYDKNETDSKYVTKVPADDDAKALLRQNYNLAERNLANLDDAAAARNKLGLANVAYVNVAQDWTQPQRNQARFEGSVSGSVTLDLAAYQTFDLTLLADVSFADPAINNDMVGQRGSIGIVPNGFAITAMGSLWKRVGDTGAPGEITGQGRIDYHIRATGRIEYAYNDVEA